MSYNHLCLFLYFTPRKLEKISYKYVFLISDTWLHIGTLRWSHVFTSTRARIKVKTLILQSLVLTLSSNDVEECRALLWSSTWCPNLKWLKSAQRANNRTKQGQSNGMIDWNGWSIRTIYQWYLSIWQKQILWFNRRMSSFKARRNCVETYHVCRM